MNPDRYRLRAWDRFNWVFYDSKNYKLMSEFWAQVEQALREANGITILQSAAIRDRNGVLIFEGDLVQSPMMGDFATYAIEWDDEENCLLWGGYALSRLVENGCFVIGNIYTHPELVQV